MSDSGLGFSVKRFIMFIVGSAIAILVFEGMGEVGGNMIKGQVSKTTSKYHPERNVEDRIKPAFVLEDKVAIENVREIVSTAGVSMVSPGPGDLRRVYDGDMERVENAIQTVLAACLELNVPCGVTAGVEDIADRLEQGFRIIIVTEPEALAAGMAAAHR